MMSDQMMSALERAATLLHAGRVTRLTRLPLRTVLPYILEWAHIEREVEVDTFFGRKMRVVLPEGISVRIWRYGVFEEDVAYYLLKLLSPGDTFIDIGAHFGFFSMLARQIVGGDGHVVSFEPMPRQRAVLEANMRANGAHCTHHLVPAAAGAASGKLTFKDLGIIGSAFATSKSVRDGRFKPLGEVEVDVRTVDNVIEDLGLTSLQLIKIDAENAEYDVILGSLETLRRLRPSIILEAGDFDDCDSGTRRVIDLVMSEGYEPYEFRDFSLRRHVVAQQYAYQNLLMIPAERAGEILA